MIIRPKHISVRNPQAPGPRSQSALCSRRRRYDARRSPIFACHLRSGVLCIQCRQARGGISLVAITVRACMPGQRIFISEKGVPVYSFFFDLTWGSQGTIEAGWRHWRQTRFGHARSERSRPQFTAHNSVRSLKNGLSLGGSSATRPCNSIPWGTNTRESPRTSPAPTPTQQACRTDTQTRREHHLHGHSASSSAQLSASAPATRSSGMRGHTKCYSALEVHHAERGSQCTPSLTGTLTD